MKKLLIGLLALCLPLIMKAAVGEGDNKEPYACVREGAVLIYANYNEKGVVNGYNRQTIKDVQKNGNNYVMNILDERLDKLKDKKGYDESLLRLEIKDGSTDIMVGGLDVQIQNSDSTSFMIPDRLAVGYKLPIGDIAVDMEGRQLVCNISENEVIKREEITNEAGTFKCYVVRNKASISIFGMSMTTITTTWYSRGVGIVKSESTMGNKIVSRRELVSIK